MNCKRIAITGGIGSGKSTAVSMLKELGYKTLSSDEIVWELYKTRRVKKLLKNTFPTAVNGIFKLTINKAELTRVAFSTKENHKKLTELITPLVMKEIDRKTKNLNGVIFVEVPLLFECGYQNLFDGVWVITRPIEARIASVKTRSNLTEERILERVSSQVDYDNMDLSSYTIIENDKGERELKRKIQEKLTEL